MPIDPFSIAIGGASLIGQGINAATQSAQNRKTREWQERMYGVQRKDALSDWNMQNEYNSPQAQMERLKAAGLNPNLVYGATAPGNSSGQVHSATPGSWSPQAPKFDFASPLAMYYDTATRSATLDNIKATNEKIKAETAATLANAGLRNSQLQYSGQFYSNQAALMGEKYDAERLSNEMKLLFQNPDAFIADNPRAKESIAWREAETKLNNLGLDSKIKKTLNEGQTLDNALKEIDRDLRKNGINPSDPIWARMLSQIFAKYIDLRNLIPGAMNFYNQNKK